MKTEKITRWACYTSQRSHYAIDFFAAGEKGSLRSWRVWETAEAGKSLRMLLDGANIEYIDNSITCVDDESEEILEEWKETEELTQHRPLFTESQDWPLCDGFWHLDTLEQSMIAEAYALSEDAEDFFTLCEQERNVIEILDMLSYPTLKLLQNLHSFEKLATLLGNFYGDTHNHERFASLLEDLGKKLMLFKWFSACYYLKNEDPEEDDEYGCEDDYDYIYVSVELYSYWDEANARAAVEYLLDSDHEITHEEQDGDHITFTITKKA